MNIINDVNLKVRSSIMELNKPYNVRFHIEKKSDQCKFIIPRPLKSHLVSILVIPTQDKESLGEFIECELFLNNESMGLFRDVPPAYTLQTFKINNAAFIEIKVIADTCDYPGDVSFSLTFK